MQESYEEDLASHFGHPRRAGVGNDFRRSVRRGGKRRLGHGAPKSNNFAGRSCSIVEKATTPTPLRRGGGVCGGVEDPEHAWKFQTREPGEPSGVRITGCGPVGKRLGRYGRPGRRRAVRWVRSTCEADEQRGGSTLSGVGRGKGPNQEEHRTERPRPDSEPGTTQDQRTVRCARRCEERLRARLKVGAV